MSLFPAFMLFSLVLWSFISIILMKGFPNVLSFMRSINFAVVCVGYIIILTLFYMLKNFFRSIEEE